MAATRKLQGEIERCLKKVAEGVETFEDIWTKVSHAANANQKEKHEADLKKEIKKLQRLRDQIKTWQASAEVKDKTSLVEHRKLIETQMERFKGLERETKTKAYSKEGLGAAVKLDPVQKRRDDCTRWLTNSIEQLNVQIDQFEAEMDGLAVKKKRDRDKAERIGSLKHWIERHRFHLKKLETLLRMLDNNAVNMDAVMKIREDVEYYTESNQEPDFDENEYIYCDINMENVDDVFINDVGMADGSRGDDQSETTNSMHSGSSPSPLNASATAAVTTDNHTEDSGKRSRRSISDESQLSCSAHKPSRHSSKQQQQCLTSCIAPCTSSSSSACSVALASSASSKTPAITSSLSTMMAARAVTAAVADSHVPTLGHAPNFAAVAAATSHTHLMTSQSSCLTACTTSSAISCSSPCSSSCSPALSTSSSYLASCSSASSSVSVSSTSCTSLHSVRQSLSAVCSTATVCATVAAITPGSSLLSDCVPPSSSPSSSSSLCPALSQSTVSATSAVVSTPALCRQSMSVTAAPPGGSALMLAPSSGGVDAATSAAVARLLQQHQQQQHQQQQQQQQQHQVNGDKCLDALSVSKVLQQQQHNIINNNNNNSDNNGANNGNTHSLDRSVLPTTTVCVGDVSLSSVDTAKSTNCTQETHVPTLYSVAPLGPVPMTKEHNYQFQMLQAAFYHMPHPSDSERLRTYLPRNPYPTPSYLPQVPPVGSDSFEFFMKLSVETLFFIFYYMEGTKAQYLAAKSLKKQSWRFHTKYMMWFQRHDEPKLITDEFEQGTYIFFDFEKWTQRRKEGFKFEYKFLEDRDLN